MEAPRHQQRSAAPRLPCTAPQARFFLHHAKYQHQPTVVSDSDAITDVTQMIPTASGRFVSPLLCPELASAPKLPTRQLCTSAAACQQQATPQAPTSMNFPCASVLVCLT